MNEDLNNSVSQNNKKSKKKTIIIWAFVIIVLIIIAPPAYRYVAIKIPEYQTKMEDQKYAPVFQKIVDECYLEVQNKYGAVESASVSKEEYGKMIENCVNSKNTNERFQFKYNY